MKDNNRKVKSTSGRSGNKKDQHKTVERIIHDEEFGEEDVELVDSEWADFERIFRYRLIYCWVGFICIMFLMVWIFFMKSKH